MSEQREGGSEGGIWLQPQQLPHGLGPCTLWCAFLTANNPAVAAAAAPPPADPAAPPKRGAPVLGLLQHGKGRVGLYGDSNCLDSSHSRSKCFKLLGHMIKWAAGEVRQPRGTAKLCGWRAVAGWLAGKAARCLLAALCCHVDRQGCGAAVPMPQSLNTPPRSAAAARHCRRMCPP